MRAGRHVLTGPFSSYPVRSLQLTFADMELKEIIERTLKGFGPIFAYNLKYRIEKQKLQSSGDLLKSIAINVTQDTGNQGLLQLSFNTYGRYFDMGNLSRSGQIPVEEIEAWIRAKGVGSFKSGYKRKIPVSDAKLINAIAWGIVKNKMKERHKRRRWYAKGVAKDVYGLFDTLVNEYQNFILQDQKNQLTNGS